LYELCRYIDDIADKKSKAKEAKLKKIVKDLNHDSNSLKLANIKVLISNNMINKIHILQLIKGVSLDLKKKVRIKNHQELISYAYLVAGTVGLMMSNILGVKEKIAYKYAVDLGIAFQLTNIARDIVEDANMNRIYLPMSWKKLSISDIKSLDKKTIIKLKSLSLKLLSVADEYYQSAQKGLAFLNLRSRFTVLLALIIYRQIGLKIIKKSFSNLYKREKVSFLEKVLCLFKCLAIFFLNINIHKKNYNHNGKLHKYIKNIVVINNKI